MVSVFFSAKMGRQRNTKKKVLTTCLPIIINSMSIFSFSLPTSMMCRSSLFHSPPALLSLPIMHATSEEVTVHEERNTVMNNALT